MSGREEFRLTPQETQSEVWLKLSRYLERRLARARDRNDGPLPPDQTATVRGEIAALKGLLDLGKSLPPIPRDAGM